MKRRLAALLCALALLPCASLAAQEVPEFSDVPGGEWYAEAVAEVSAQGIMTGVEENRFAPDELVTRATVITVLWRMEGQPQAGSRESFSDVDPDGLETAWYAAAAAWAKEENIAAGYDDGGFHGNDVVTREQLSMFLLQYAVWKGLPVAEGPLGLFVDADQVSDWALPAVAHAVGSGLLRGDDSRLLDPQGPASRAELASILQRMLIPVAG